MFYFDPFVRLLSSFLYLIYILFVDTLLLSILKYKQAEHIGLLLARARSLARSLSFSPSLYPASIVLLVFHVFVIHAQYISSGHMCGLLLLLTSYFFSPILYYELTIE